MLHFNKEFSNSWSLFRALNHVASAIDWEDLGYFYGWCQAKATYNNHLTDEEQTRYKELAKKVYTAKREQFKIEDEKRSERLLSCTKAA